MLVKSIILKNSLTIDDLPDAGCVANYLTYVQGQILSFATSIIQKKEIKGGLGIEIDFAIDYFLHKDKDYQNLTLSDVFDIFFSLCKVSSVFDFINWLNDADGEQIDEQEVIGIINNEIEFTEKTAKLIIKRIEEHIKIETALKRALYVHTSVGVRKNFEKDSFEDNFKINDYNQDSTQLILYIQDLMKKITHATESLRYENLTFSYVVKFQYQKIEE